MSRLQIGFFLLGAALLATGGGCASGEIDSDLTLMLEKGNLQYYEEVVFPSSRRNEMDEIFAGVPTYLPLYLSYKTTRVDAIITQRGDLQITSHLTAGSVYRKEFNSSDYDYLKEETWNGESDVDRYGEALHLELTERDNAYDQLNDDIRLIMLVNLPEADDSEESWPSTDWEYPAELVANYQDVLLDEEDQEHDIPEDDIELMSRMIIGGELFETTLGERFNLEDGVREESEDPNLILEELSMPGEDGKLGVARGSFDLMLEADSFSASSGVAVITGTFDVEVHDDQWALEDLDVQEDLNSEGL